LTLKPKSGFTLVEMLIVLGIIAILGLISEGALLANRNYQRLAGPVEEIVSLMREAQNRSISIVKDGEYTKAWEFKLDGATYSIKALNSDSGNLVESPTATPDSDIGNLPDGTAVNVSYSTGPSNNYSTFYATFSTPFARTYLGSTAPADLSGNCTWNDGGELRTRPAKDWYIDPLCTTVLSPAAPGIATIDLTFKGNKITVTVNTNGDISYQ